MMPEPGREPSRRSPVQPIETTYAGCRFRSRLEARWAVFFDALGAEWHYEPQGFVIDGTPYLPDFHLPQASIWVEVKGEEQAIDKELMAKAPLHLPGGRLLILGPIPAHRDVASNTWAWMAIEGHVGEPPHYPDYTHGAWFSFAPPGRSLLWPICPALETSTATPFDADTDGWLSGVPDMLPVPWQPQVTAAYDAARSARFEFGR